MDCALGGFVMTRDERHGLGGRRLVSPRGNYLPDSPAGVHAVAMPPPGRFQQPGGDRAIIADAAIRSG